MSDSESSAGRELGDFRILREIGRGGMGTVYLAEQCSLRRTVALKVLNPGVSLNPNVVKRFQREAEAAGRLHHPYIVQVFAVGEEDGTHFFAMEYVEGESLDQIVRRLRKGAKIDDLSTHPSQWSDASLEPKEGGEASGSESADSDADAREGESTDSTASETQEYILGAARLMAEISDALDYAHRHGIIHRDVKPHNILVDRTGRPFLVDFGLAQAEGAMGITKTGEVFGTPTYMSPEQVAGSLAKIDHRTDVYSLGCSFYELITLHRPFEGKTPQETVRKILTVEPRDPRKINRAVPRDLATVIVKCIEKDPDKRYATCAALQADLKRFLAGEPIQARPIGVLEKGARFVARRSWQSAAVGVIAILALIVAFQGFKSRATSKDMHQIEAARLAQEADSLYASNFGEAERKVLEALDKDSHCARAHLVHGKILRGQGKFEDARVAFDQAARFDPKDPEPLRLAGDLLKSRRDFRAAADIYREALTRDERMHEVHDSLAECLRELGLREDSTKEFERAEAIRREQAMPLVEDAQRLIAKGDELAGSDPAASSAQFAAAESKLGEALQKHSSLHEATLWRGVARLRLARFADALTDLNQVASKNPRDPAGFFYRAELHLLQGRSEEARRDFERALQIEKAKGGAQYAAKAQLRLAQIFLASKEWEKALDPLNALIQSDGANQEARLLRGICLAERNADTEASEDFAKTETLDGPLAPAAVLGKAFLLEKAGRMEKAYAELLSAEKRMPADARILYHRARIGIGLRRKDSADREALDSAIAMDPANAGAYLVRFGSRIEESGAERDFFEALDLDPEFAVQHFFEGVRGNFSGWTNLVALAPALPGAASAASREAFDPELLRFLSQRWRAGIDLEIPTCATQDLQSFVADLHNPAPKVREYAEKQLFSCGWNAIAALRSSIETPEAEPDVAALLDRLEEQRRKSERQSVERWLDQSAKSALAAKRLADLAQEAGPSLIAILAESQSPMRKHLAYKTLVAAKLPESAAGIEPLLKSADRLVRFYAIRALTSLGKAPSSENLQALFREESGPVRIAVLFAAAMAGDQQASIRTLVAEALRDGRALTRFMGARLIGERGDRTLALPLRKALQIESEAEVREQIFRSLAQLGEEGAVLWMSLLQAWGSSGSVGSGTAEQFFRALPRSAAGRAAVKGDEPLASRFVGPDSAWVRIHWIHSWDEAQLIERLDLLLRMSESADPAESFAGKWALRRLGVGADQPVAIPEGAAGLVARGLLAESPPRALESGEKERLRRALEKAGRPELLQETRKGSQ